MDNNPIDAEKNRNLDRALDAALAQYAAVGPRTGLEDRILANLRSQPAPVGYLWWRWSIAAVAAVVVLAATLAWRSAKPHPPVVVRHTPTTPQRPQPQPAVEAAHASHTPAPRRIQSHATAMVAADTPKLDVFPAPQPLSREEITLARYVRDFPQEAVLIAQSQEEAEIEMQKKMGKTEPMSSDQQER